MIGRRFVTNIVYCALVALFAIAASGSLTAQQTSADELFQEALHEEVALGNFQSAIELYEKVLGSGDVELSLKAELRLAGLYTRVGWKAEARKQFENIVDLYADEPTYREIIEAAREALAELGTATPRELSEPGYTNSIAPDGSRGAFNMYDGKGMNVGVIDYETDQITWITDLEWTKNNGVAELPIWAPDSQRLAYSQVTPEGITEIRVVVPGETPQVIFRNEHRREPGNITASVSDWLRDDSALVVSALQDDGSNTLGLVSLRDGSFTQLRTVPWQGTFELAKASLDGRFLLIQEDGDLFLLATDGSQMEQLTDHPAADGAGHNLAIWSRDGNYVLFTSDRGGTMGLWALPVKDGRRAGTPFLIQAPWQGSLLGWADDELAYSTGFNIQSIYTVPVDPQSGKTAGAVRLIPYPDTGGYLQFPVWSADGREIAFLADTFPTSSAPARVVIQPLDGRRAREYLMPENVHYPMTVLRWLSDGIGVSFMAQNRLGRPILVLGALADGTWETTPLPEKTDNYVFAWSATGDSFYYSRGADDLPEGSSQLIQHQLATGEEEVLHTAEEEIKDLTLSPGGSELAFRLRPFPCCPDDFRNWGLWVLSLETGSVRRLVPAWNGGGDQPSWSPDGNHLSFECYEVEEPRGICIVDLDTGKVTKNDLDYAEVFSKTVAPVEEVYTIRNTLWSPADNRLLFAIHATEQRVMIMADPLAVALEKQPSSSHPR